MTTSDVDNHLPQQDAFPLLICGLPRAGTSFLFALLSTHTAFANENYKDKELRYYEKLLSNRPWGGIDTVSQKKFEGIDTHIMPEIVRTTDALLRKLRGGPQGHYINANPRDIFYSEILLQSVPEMKFIISLRDPLTNIWSALNYPSNTWGEKDDKGFFREEDVRRTAEHWNKVANHILRYELYTRPQSFFLLEQERLATGSSELHHELEGFLGLPGIAKILDENANLVIHSSFIEGEKNKDRRFEDGRSKLAHFNNAQRMFAENGRYASLVLDICGPMVERLAKFGLLKRGPACSLLASHAPLRKGTGGESLSGSLYYSTVRFLLKRLSEQKTLNAVVAGLERDATRDPLNAHLSDETASSVYVVEPVTWRAKKLRQRFADCPGITIVESACVIEPAAGQVELLCARETAQASIAANSSQTLLSPNRAMIERAGLSRAVIDQNFDVRQLPGTTLNRLLSEKPGVVDVLQVQSAQDSLSLVMSVDFVAHRPLLVLLPHSFTDREEWGPLHNVFTNLGYLCVDIDDSLIAVRRDWLDEDLAQELQQFHTPSVRS